MHFLFPHSHNHSPTDRHESEQEIKTKIFLAVKARGQNKYVGVPPSGSPATSNRYGLRFLVGSTKLPEVPEEIPLVI